MSVFFNGYNLCLNHASFKSHNLFCIFILYFTLSIYLFFFFVPIMNCFLRLKCKQIMKTAILILLLIIIITIVITIIIIIIIITKRKGKHA